MTLEKVFTEGEQSRISLSNNSGNSRLKKMLRRGGFKLCRGNVMDRKAKKHRFVENRVGVTNLCLEGGTRRASQLFAGAENLP